MPDSKEPVAPDNSEDEPAGTELEQQIPALEAKQAPGPRSVDVIYERLLGAILEHRLPPGTKLGEERLAAVFGVSRTQVRQALARLTHDRIVTVLPIAAPSSAAPPSTKRARCSKRAG